MSIIVNLAKTAAHMCMRMCSSALSSHSSYCCSNSPAGAGTYIHTVGSIKRAAWIYVTLVGFRTQQNTVPLVSMTFKHRLTRKGYRMSISRQSHDAMAWSIDPIQSDVISAQVHFSANLGRRTDIHLAEPGGSYNDAYYINVIDNHFRITA